MAGSSPVNGSEQPKYLDINRSIQPVDWRKQSLNRCQQPEHLHLDHSLQSVNGCEQPEYLDINRSIQPVHRREQSEHLHLDHSLQSVNGREQSLDWRKGNTP